MDTTTAATKARRTVATIRTWCRRGVITATKRAGRWTIDATSLDYRLSLDKPRPLTADHFIALGGRRWTRGDHDRVYINNWTAFSTLETTHYGTGRVSSACFNGHPIANSRVSGILNAVSSVYYDVNAGDIVVWHRGATELDVRYLHGERDTVNLVAIIGRNLRAAAAAAL